MSCLLGLSIQLRLLVIEVNQPLLFVNSALHFLKLISVLISRQISIKVISDLLRLVVDRVVVATHVVLFQVWGARQGVWEDHPVLDLLTNILVEGTFHLRWVVQTSLRRVVVVFLQVVRLQEAPSTAAILRRIFLLLWHHQVAWHLNAHLWMWKVLLVNERSFCRLFYFLFKILFKFSRWQQRNRIGLSRGHMDAAFGSIGGRLDHLEVSVRVFLLLRHGGDRRWDGHDTTQGADLWHSLFVLLVERVHWKHLQLRGWWFDGWRGPLNHNLRWVAGNLLSLEIQLLLLRAKLGYNFLLGFWFLPN